VTREVLNDNLAWLRPSSSIPRAGKLMLCVQSYVVRTQHHTILIDSCVGNHKERTNYPSGSNDVGSYEATWRRST